MRLTTTSVKFLTILDHFLVVATVSVDRWHHHSWFYNGRDWCALNTMNSVRVVCCWTWEADMYSRTFAQRVWWSNCGRECCQTVGRTVEETETGERASWQTAEVSLFYNDAWLHKCAYHWDDHCCRTQSTVLTLHPQIFTFLVLRKTACRRGWRTEERYASVAAVEGGKLYQAGIRAPFKDWRRLWRRWRLYFLQQCRSKVIWQFHTRNWLTVVTSLRILHVL